MKKGSLIACRKGRHRKLKYMVFGSETDILSIFVFIRKLIRYNMPIKLGLSLMFSLTEEPTDSIHFCVRITKFTFLYLIPVISAGLFVHSL